MIYAHSGDLMGYKIGDKFKTKDGYNRYMIASIGGNEIIFLSIGNYKKDKIWWNGITNDTNDITYDELKLFIGTYFDRLVDVN